MLAVQGMLCSSVDFLDVLERRRFGGGNADRVVGLVSCTCHDERLSFLQLHQCQNNFPLP
jgi:hypothetical protein